MEPKRGKNGSSITRTGAIGTLQDGTMFRMPGDFQD